MSNELDDEAISNAINQITEKLGKLMLDEFLAQPPELQINIVLVKSAQLLLANILCHVVMDKSELEKISDIQGIELKELTLNCAFTAFADKFELNKH